jgi:RNA-directed DNA polymerase
MTKTLLLTTPDEQKTAFLLLENRRDVATLLGYRYSGLVYQLYKVPPEKRYETFSVPKKSGGLRTIHAPSLAIKHIQRRLNEVLRNTFTPKPVVFGFTLEKNIVDNASKHKKKNWVLNIDLENFFPSINFGRVRGLFMGKPYNLPPEVATVLAQICCFNNSLPQGAPTSPVISNMICAKMDSQLQDLAWKHRCFYTRYADDITFSTTLRELPLEIAKVNAILSVELGQELVNIIQQNGFEINESKVRAFACFQRQEVTGLTVNKFPNVRRKYVMQIRSMLHAWDKKGLQAAEAEHHELYSKKHRHPDYKPPAFKKVVKGKLDFLKMVKGRDNKVYKKYQNQYQGLILREKGLRRIKSFDERNADKQPRVYTEGITDALILKTAWKKLYPEIPCPFAIKDCHPTRKTSPETTVGGADVLKNHLINLNEEAQFISIGVFDRDDAGLSALNNIKDYEVDAENDWRISLPRKAGCFTLPVPIGREKYETSRKLSIEFYFSDEILSLKNKDGKGLSFSVYIGKREIREHDDPETVKKYAEERVIKDDGGKMLFAKEIVPALGINNFEPFKATFEKISKLIEKIETIS